MEEVAASPFSGPLAVVSALLGELSGDTACDALTTTAVNAVAGAVSASVTTFSNGRLRTTSASDDAAVRADVIQYEIGSGPCMDALRRETFYRSADLRDDPCWPEYGARVAREAGFLSLLSYRLNAGLAAAQLDASLNIYSDRPAAFDDVAAASGLLLATHGALAIALEWHRERAGSLERALESSREIGIAVGVLMSQHKVSRARAFDLLRRASQSSNRKVREVAVHVVLAGTLPRSSDM